MEEQDCFFARFRTDDLPEKGRVSAVRDVLLAKPVAFDVNALPDDSFYADMQVRALPGLEITAGHVVSYTQRNRSIMQDGSDDLLLSINLGGSMEIIQRGRTVNVTPGSAHLGWCGDPIQYYTNVQRGMGLRIPRRAIAPFVPGIDDQIGRHIPAASDNLHLIDTYIRSLERDAFHATPGMTRMAVGHVHDLIALAIGSTGDAAALAAGRGQRAAKMLAIKNDIADLLAQGDVTAELLAARHSITPRYVRRLFELEGSSLSAYVVEERLRRAEQLLTSPLHRHRPISHIAFDVGFHDLSYFNKTFRRRFGMSPTDVRQSQ